MGAEHPARPKRMKPIGSFVEDVVCLTEDEPHQRPSAITAVAEEAGSRHRCHPNLPREPDRKFRIRERALAARNTEVREVSQNVVGAFRRSTSETRLDQGRVEQISPGPI